MDVVPGGAGLPVAALQKQDFLRDSRCDGRGETALASLPETWLVSAPHHPAESVVDHLDGQESCGSQVSPGSGAVGESGEEWGAMRALSRGLVQRRRQGR